MTTDKRSTSMRSKSLSSQDTSVDPSYVGLRLEDVIDDRAKRASSRWNTRRR